MIDLKLELELNKHYINYWSIFSRLLLLVSHLKNNDNYLIVVENEKILNNYLKIAEFVAVDLYNLSNFSDFTNLLYNNYWKYIVTKDFFNLDIDKFSQLEYRDIFTLKVWEDIEISDITKKMNEFWYHYSDYDNPWHFRVTWDLFNFTDYLENNVKVSFWWNTIEEIYLNDKKVDFYHFWRNQVLDFFKLKNTTNNEILSKCSSTKMLFIIDSLDFYSSYDEIISNVGEYGWIQKPLPTSPCQGRKNNENYPSYIIFNSLSENDTYIDLSIDDLFIEKLEDFKILLESSATKKYIFTKNRNTIKNFLELNNLHNVEIFDTTLTNLKSFKINWNQPTIVICDDNISRIFVKKRIRRSLSKNLDLMMQIKPWDFIVHIDHGIWIFREIVTKELPWTSWSDVIKKEYITIEYKNNDKLFVPITEVSRVSKYVWVDNPKLTWLSTKEWERKLKKVSEDVEIIAKELLDVYAKRKLVKWYKFKSFPKEEGIFANSFNHIYTEDQLHVIWEIYKEMESENPMDRLLSWDVWFGKTEIAFASIYKSIINWKQAALISPLVVLAYEHYEKAIDRFSDFPINIWVVTRFEKPAVIKATLEKLKNWSIDLIIWTHRLLSEDIQFKDLWLLVVDEEHKFWVKDKEKIKQYKWNIDILSMSATPIPRSLNMALNWIKSVSMLTTPPIGRQPIQTVVMSFDDKVIFDAGKREFDRWGQLFFIHNRVETINAVWNYLKNIFPWKKIAIAHWQLSWDSLEQRIIEFKRRQYDILLATTVVENGIDFANVNTIFINDAQNFWISQIHQLRWRVGRSDKKWYCYLLFKKDKIKEDAAKRLKTIVDYSHLWAWFELAVKDLEIRWGWDILGIRQSGQAHEIWVNLFIEMLEDKVEELKNKVDRWIDLNQTKNPLNSFSTQTKTPLNSPLFRGDEDTGDFRWTYKKISTSIDLNIQAYIDDMFFSSELDKINFYREIESLDNLEDLENIIGDFKEINQNIPKSTSNFFDLLKIKLKASEYMIISIKKLWINYQIDFNEDINVEQLKNFLKLDKEVKFSVVWLNKLRSSQKNFENEEKFLKYMLQIFFANVWKKKIKLKLKGN